MLALDINKLNKKYEHFHLKDISFRLEKGYIMGFIGANCAGKKTTIKSILNLVRMDNMTKHSPQLAIFNIIFISMYYKTAYKYGAAAIASITAAILFAGGAEWLGIQNSFVFDLFKGTGADNSAIQLSILLSGIVVFAIFTIIAYHIAHKRFEKVEM